MSFSIDPAFIREEISIELLPRDIVSHIPTCLFQLGEQFRVKHQVSPQREIKGILKPEGEQNMTTPHQYCNEKSY